MVACDGWCNVVLFIRGHVAHQFHAAPAELADPAEQCAYNVALPTELVSPANLV